MVVRLQAEKFQDFIQIWDMEDCGFAMVITFGIILQANDIFT